MSDEEPKLLDQDTLELLYDAIGDSIHSIIKLYLQDVPYDLQTMHAALAANDLETVHRLAHSLKASSANLGAMQTSFLAAELEHGIAENKFGPSAVTEVLNKIKSSFDQTRIIMENWKKN